MRTSLTSLLQRVADSRNQVLSVIAVALLLLLTGGAIAGTAQAATIGKSAVEGQTYTIATDTTWAPFEFEIDGELRGIDMDLINAIADDQDSTSRSSRSASTVRCRQFRPTPLTA